MTGNNQATSARSCVLTIAAVNYLHFVRVLMDSAARHLPAADRFLGLCDRLEGEDLSAERFSILEPDELDIPDRESFLFRYTLLELSTAIKPFLIEKLMTDHGYDKVIYLDPDIRLYDRFDGVLDRLDTSDLVLTPHITAPIDDGKRPSELDLLVCGTYNLGFCAFRKTPDTLAFLKWWQSKLLFDCIVDKERGLFVDQKWMEFAPSLLPKVHVERHPGWNAAYWNLPSRTVREDAGRVTVNDQPLMFYHFSGFNPVTNVFSKHQDRYSMENVPRTVRRLAEAYGRDVMAAGFESLSKRPNAFAAFPDGTRIPDGARRIYRENIGELLPRMPDPRNRDADALCAYLNEPADLPGGGHPLLTRMAHDVWQHGPDIGLKQQFPDPGGIHAVPFARWLLANAAAMTDLSERFLSPLRHQLGDEQAAGADGEQGLSQKLYHLAWRFKHLTHWILPLAVRRRIHDRLFHRAYAAEGNQKDRGASYKVSDPDGLNIIGYLSSELGIGEAARCLARSAAAAGIPVNLVDYQKGSSSRKQAVVEGVTSSGTQHAVNLIVLNPEQFKFAVADFGPACFRDRYTIACWNWELPELPDSWLEPLPYLDEIWAPSSFCQQAFSHRVDVPVVLMPYGVELEAEPGVTRETFGLPADRHLFLTMFDVFSIPQRKNPMAAVEAFRQARDSFRRPAALVLKMINSDHDTGLAKEIDALCRAEKDVIRIDGYLDRPRLNALFRVCDAYVSLHRAEGFGFPIAEAMALGKPVIATGWSSNLDFMTPWNSFPVPYRLIKLADTYGPYPKGSTWADPDIGEAARLMTLAVNDEAAAEKVGRQAAMDMAEHLSHGAVGGRIRKRLAMIMSRPAASRG